MPGLVGIITRMPQERAEAELLGMVAALRHESWYASKTWSDASLGIYIGWVERSESRANRMPMTDTGGDLVLVLSGEEFSGATVQRDLSELPRDKKLSWIQGLNGSFHGVLADRIQGTVKLFNDRYGMGRVYVHQSGDAFYFAAEAKAILAVRPELRAIDPSGLAEFISCGCTLENRTLFRNVRVLPAGSAWVFEQSAVPRKASYFDPKLWEEQAELDAKSYYWQLRDVFSASLPKYLNGTEKAGISLTGGLDSRMIMAWSAATPGALPCYSFGGPYRESQDVKIARKVARACGQPHQVLSVGDEFLSTFAHYSERTVYLTDGCVEVKHAPDLYVNEIARAIAPARITGNYGGEVLRRVRAFRPIDPPPGLYSHDVLNGIEQAKGTYRGLMNQHPLSFAVFRQAPWHHFGLHALEQSQLAMRSPFLDNEFVKTVFRAPKETLASDSISLRLIADGNPTLSSIRTDRGLGGNLPAWAVAARKSWLDFTFKAEYAWDYGMPQSVANVDHALRGLHLEHLFLGRHKFYHYRVWYRDALSNYIREMLLDSRSLSRIYLNRDVAEDLVNGHVHGSRNATTAIHKLLTLEHIHRLFIDAP